jgi:hypothetical protein
MKKRQLIHLAIFILFLVALVIDTSTYDLAEADLEANLHEKLSEIAAPETADYHLLDQYNQGRLRFYSGQMQKETQNVPFIFAFKKHWLLPRYELSDYVLRYSHTIITNHAPELKTLVFEYTAHHQDEDLSLVVERSINNKTVLMLGAYIFAAFLGRVGKEQ